MNANLKSCSITDKDEKLFILEVVVDSVSIYAEKLHKILPNELGVDLQFIDMPLFRIFQSGTLLTKPLRSKEMTRESGMITVHFNAGKMYMFTRPPVDLVEKMRAKPMLLDVYKIKEIQICPEDVIKHPLGNSVIPIPGCICDHVMMAGNDKYHLPKSYEIKNTYGLVDEEYKPSGYISIIFRLTCFGTYMFNSYSIVGDKLLFRNPGSFNEFLCTKVLYSDEDERRAAEESKRFCSPEVIHEQSELDTPSCPINVAGLVFVCRELSMRDGYPPNVIHPNYPPKIPLGLIEEISFDVDRLRRKGFQQVDEEEFENIVDNAIITSHRACRHARCSGNICTGQN